MSNEDEKLKWCFSALKIMERSEPFIEMAKFYRIEQQYTLAYFFAKAACDLPYPAQCILWVDNKAYNHDRWHELSIAAFYVKQYAIGKEACLLALKSGINKALNEKNLSFYENAI